jgi:hypothetical protein
VPMPLSDVQTELKPLTKIHITDTRPDASPNYNFTGDYDANLIRDLVHHSVAAGLDPWHALGTALQETSLDPVQMSGQGLGVLAKSKQPLPPGKYDDRGVQVGGPSPGSAFASGLQFKLDESRKRYHNKPISDELLLQGYQGYGHLPPGAWFGQRNLHGERDRPQGKRVLSLIRYALKNNPDLVALVQDIMWEGSPPPPKGK